MADKTPLEVFKEKAVAVSMVLAEARDLAEAMEYAVGVCERKETCELLFSGCDDPLSTDGQVYCERHNGSKVLAAPGLSGEEFARLKALGEEKGFHVLDSGMRHNLPGIDVTFTTGDLAIADTATCVLCSGSEELRIATMVCEEHVIALPKSKVVGTAGDAKDFLQEIMRNGPTYTAFISGASRTSDIERVLTLGVHGPLVLHIVLMEG